MNNIIIAHIGTDASGKLTTRVLDTAKVLGIARDAVVTPPEARAAKAVGIKADES